MGQPVERSFYGRVTKVYPGGVLVDVELDNGERCARIATWEVFPAMVPSHGVQAWQACVQYQAAGQ